MHHLIPCIFLSCAVMNWFSLKGVPCLLPSDCWRSPPEKVYRHWMNSNGWIWIRPYTITMSAIWVSMKASRWQLCLCGHLLFLEGEAVLKYTPFLALTLPLRKDSVLFQNVLVCFSKNVSGTIVYLYCGTPSAQLC